MVTVEIYRDPNGEMRGFLATGHSGYAEHGKDIVCAAVAAVTQTAVLGILERLDVPVEVEQASGHLRCVLPQAAGAVPGQMQTILETMLLGLREIERQHRDFVRVGEEIVPG